MGTISKLPRTQTFTLMHQATTLVTNDKDDIKGDDQPRKICPCTNGYTEWTFRTPEKRKPATCMVVPLQQSINLCMLAISERSIGNITKDLYIPWGSNLPQAFRPESM